MSNPIQVQIIHCKTEGFTEYGKVGFKVRYNGAKIHHTGYDFATRTEAVDAARKWVEENYPGCWQDKGGRRVS